MKSRINDSLNFIKSNLFKNKLSNETNQYILFGIFTILIVLWIIIYAVPILFVSFFNTLLGNIILLVIVILISTYNYKYGIIVGAIFVILYRSYKLSSSYNLASSVKEGFEWNSSSVNDFLLMQNTINPGIVFDTKVIQNQASQQEVDYFIKFGQWPWSKEVEDLYLEALARNSYVRTYPNDELRRIKTIYNQNAILDIISSQTKEGHFLLRGVSIGNTADNMIGSGIGDFRYTSGLTHPMNNVVKCYPNGDNGYELQQIKYNNKAGVFKKEIDSAVNYGDLEQIIPGFKFVNGPCNPCQNLETKGSCPFILDISGNKLDGISSVWKYLWGL
jgi:hypothetical protein